MEILQFAVIGDVLLSKNQSPKIWMMCGSEKGRGLKNKTRQKEVSALAARSVLIKNQQLLHCLGSWSQDSPCRNCGRAILVPLIVTVFLSIPLRGCYMGARWLQMLFCFASVEISVLLPKPLSKCPISKQNKK